jgi:CRP-like cAMP-binding protein
VPLTSGIVNRIGRERERDEAAIGAPRWPAPPLQPAGALANRILGGLPLQDRARLLLSLQPVTLELGDVVCEAGARMEHVYFPTTSVMSLLYTMEDGATAEMGLAGNDGMLGLALFLGGETTPARTAVVVGGGALRMRARTLREEFAAGGALQARLLRYTQAFMTQVAQTAVCNRLHAVEQRLCRWLLMCSDRVHSDQLQMTQELISNMLGGRRETVTVAAGRLQDAGLIRYARGHIDVLDRRGLEAAVCECYSIVEAELDRLCPA